MAENNNEHSWAKRIASLYDDAKPDEQQIDYTNPAAAYQSMATQPEQTEDNTQYVATPEQTQPTTPQVYQPLADRGLMPSTQKAMEQSQTINSYAPQRDVKLFNEDALSDIYPKVVATDMDNAPDYETFKAQMELDPEARNKYLQTYQNANTQARREYAAATQPHYQAYQTSDFMSSRDATPTRQVVKMGDGTYIDAETKQPVDAYQGSRQIDNQIYANQIKDKIRDLVIAGKNDEVSKVAQDTLTSERNGAAGLLGLQDDKQFGEIVNLAANSIWQDQYNKLQQQGQSILDNLGERADKNMQRFAEQVAKNNEMFNADKENPKDISLYKPLIDSMVSEYEKKAASLGFDKEQIKKLKEGFRAQAELGVANYYSNEAQAKRMFQSPTAQQVYKFGLDVLGGAGESTYATLLKTQQNNFDRMENSLIDVINQGSLDDLTSVLRGTMTFGTDAATRMFSLGGMAYNKIAPIALKAIGNSRLGSRIISKLVAQGLTEQQALGIFTKSFMDKAAGKLFATTTNGALTFGIKGMIDGALQPYAAAQLSPEMETDARNIMLAFSDDPNAQAKDMDTSALGRVDKGNFDLFMDSVKSTLGGGFWGGLSGAAFVGTPAGEWIGRNRGLTMKLVGDATKLAINASGMTGVQALENKIKTGEWGDMSRMLYTNMLSLGLLDSVGIISRVRHINEVKANEHRNYVSGEYRTLMRQQGIPTPDELLQQLASGEVHLPQPEQGRVRKGHTIQLFRRGKDENGNEIQLTDQQKAMEDNINGFLQNTAIPETLRAQVASTLTGHTWKLTNPTSVSEVRPEAGSKRFAVDLLDNEGNVIDTHYYNSREQAINGRNELDQQITVGDMADLVNDYIVRKADYTFGTSILNEYDNGLAQKKTMYDQAVERMQHGGKKQLSKKDRRRVENGLTQHEQDVITLVENQDKIADIRQKLADGEELSEEETGILDAQNRLYAEHLKKSADMSTIIASFEQQNGLNEGEFDIIRKGHDTKKEAEDAAEENGGEVIKLGNKWYTTEEMQVLRDFRKSVADALSRDDAEKQKVAEQNMQQVVTDVENKTGVGNMTDEQIAQADEMSNAFAEGQQLQGEQRKQAVEDAEYLKGLVAGKLGVQPDDVDAALEQMGGNADAVLERVRATYNDPKVTEMFRQYLVARERSNGAMSAIQQKMNAAGDAAEQTARTMVSKETGMVQRVVCKTAGGGDKTDATEDGQELYITTGHVNRLDDGTVVSSGSSGFITAIDASGKEYRISADQIKSADEPTDADTFVKAARETAMRQAVAADEAELSGNVLGAAGEKVDIKVGNERKTATIIQSDGENAVVDIEGKQQQMSIKDLQDAHDAAMLEDTAARHADLTETKAEPETEAATNRPKAETPEAEEKAPETKTAPAAEVKPEEKREPDAPIYTDGKIDTNMNEPADVFDYYNGKEYGKDFMKSEAEQARKDLEEAKAIKPEGATAKEREQAHADKAAKVKEAQERVDFWNKVLAEPERRKNALNEVVDKAEPKEETKPETEGEKETPVTEQLPASTSDSQRQAHNERVEREGGLIINDESEAVGSETATMLDALGKAFGTKVVYNSGLVKLGKDGNPLPAKLQPNGRRVTLKDGSSYIELNPYTQQPVKFVFGHELTHLLKHVDDGSGNAGRLWKQYMDTVEAYLGKERFAKLTKDAYDLWNAANKARGEEALGMEAAKEEVCCNFAGDLMNHADFADQFIKAMQTTGSESTGAIQKIRDFIAKFLNAIRSINKPTLYQRSQAENLEAAKDLWTQLAKNAVRQARDAKEQSKKSAENFSDKGVVDPEKPQDAEAGIVNGKVEYSQGTYMPYIDNKGQQHVGTREGMRQFMDEHDMPEDEKKKILTDMDFWYDLTNRLASFKKDNGQFAFDEFRAWADRIPAYKEIAGKFEKALSSLVSNGEYPLNVELSTDCIKREALTDLYNNIAARGGNFFAGLTSADIEALKGMMENYAIQVACPLCFVEGKRQAIGNWSQTIVDDWNRALNEALRLGAKEEHYNPKDHNGKAIKGGRDRVKNVDALTAKVGGFGFYKGDGVTDVVDGKPIESMTPEEKREHERLVNSVFSILSSREGINETDLRDLRENQIEYQQKLTEFEGEWQLAHPDEVFDPNKLTDTQKDELEAIATKGHQTVYRKMVDAIRQYPELRHTLSQNDLIGYTGLDALRKSDGEAAATLFSLIRSRFGVATPKVVQEAEPYAGEILEVPESQIAKAMVMGGGRMFSFSDFDLTKVFDIMQIIGDHAARKIGLQSYSKEVSYILLCGKTGTKINMSMLPEAVVPEALSVALKKAKGKQKNEILKQIKENAGLQLDENGQIEGFTWSNSHSIKEDFAKHIFHDPDYNGNCGAILVGISVNHALWACGTPYIRQVIPFHLSGVTTATRKLTDVGFYRDFTRNQNTSVADKFCTAIAPEGTDYNSADWKSIGGAATKKAHGTLADFDFYEGVNDVDANGKPTWDLRHKVAEYVDWCNTGIVDNKGKRLSVRPRFSWGLNSGEYAKWCESEGYKPNKQIMDMMDSQTKEYDINGKKYRIFDGYYKMIADYNVYKPIFDAEGNMVGEETAPLRPVTTDFARDPETLKLVFGTDEEGNVISDESMLANREKTRANSKKYMNEMAAHAIEYLNSKRTAKDKKVLQSYGSGDKFQNASDSELYMNAQKAKVVDMNNEKPDPDDPNGGGGVRYDYSYGGSDNTIDGVMEHLKKGVPVDSYKGSLGVPYQGSKNKNGREIVDVLPQGKRFVDLFSGGGAMTHAAMLSGKYDGYHMNDKYPMGQQLFLDAIDGKYHDYDRHVTKEEFYNGMQYTPEGLMHSFNGNGRSYAEIDRHGRDKAAEQVKRVKSLEALKEYRDKITDSADDYQNVPVQDGDVLYADIPYEKTGNTSYSKAGKFDMKAFTDWAGKLNQPVYVSSFEAPEGFTEIWHGKEEPSFRAGSRKVERLFVQDKFADAEKARIEQDSKAEDEGLKETNSNWKEVLSSFEPASQRNSLGTPNLTQSEFDAKVQNNSEIVEGLKEIYDNLGENRTFSPKELIGQIAIRLGVKDVTTDGSDYREIVLPTGDIVNVRTSNHYATAIHFQQRGKQRDYNYGVVIKTSQSKFKANPNVNYLEMVYFGDHVKDNAEMQKAIVKGISTFIEKGTFADMPKPEALHVSGEFKNKLNQLRAEGKTQYSYGQAGTTLAKTKAEVEARDKEYAKAVESGDTAKAKDMLKEEANRELNTMILPDDNDIEGFKYHTGEAPKKTFKRYAVLNVSPEGFKAAYAGNQQGTPVGVWLDAQNLQSYTSDMVQFDDGTFASYIKGDTGASVGSKFSPEKREEYGLRGSDKFLLERGGKHSSDVPNFSQMNLHQNENGEKVNSAKDGALPHNKLIFEIEYGTSENGDLTDYVKEHGRMAKGKNQGLAKIEPNQYYDFKTNPNAVGNWGIGGTFRITRLVPHEEIVSKTEEYKKNAITEANRAFEAGDISKADRDKRIKNAEGISVQKWVGGYHPEDFGLSVDTVNKLYEEGTKQKVLDITYDDNGNLIPLSQRYDNEKNDIRYSYGEAGSTLPKEEERQRKQQESPAFKKWFGDWEKDPEHASKATNPDGTPAVLYHGTSWNPYEEKKGKAVFKSGWFTGMKSRAKGYGEPVAVYLNLRNPAIIYDGRGKDSDKSSPLPENFDLNDPSTWGEYDGYISYADFPDKPAELTEGQKRVIKFRHPNDYEQVMKQMLAERPVGRQIFSAIPRYPSQIKSATGNNGDFDGSNPDIRYSYGEAGTTLLKDKEESPMKNIDFRRWFGKSVAKDKEGTPVVTWHGTKSLPFTEFQDNEANSKGLVWTSSSKPHSSQYANWNAIPDEQFGAIEEAQNRGLMDRMKYPLYVKLERPLDLGDVEQSCDSRSFAKIAEAVNMTPQELFEKCAKNADYDVEDGLSGAYIYNVTRTPEFADALKAAGYDGVTALEYGYDPDWKKGMVRTYGVLSSRQLKSATANNGFYDYSDRNIDHSYGEAGTTLPEGKSQYSYPIGGRMRQRKGESDADFIQRQQDYINLVVKHPEEARQRVTEEIRAMLDGERFGAISKRTLNQMLTEVRDATPNNLQRVIKDVTRTMNTLSDNALTKQMDRLLSFKTQKRNGRNMSIAKSVDDATRKAFDFLRGRLVDFNATVFDDEKHQINADQSRLYRETKYLQKQHDNTTDPNEQLRLEQIIAENQQKIEDNKEALKEINEKIAGAQTSAKPLHAQQVADMITDLNDKQNNALTGNGEWTEDDEAQLTALHILNKRLRLDDLDSDMTRLKLAEDIARMQHIAALEKKASQTAALHLADMRAFRDAQDDVLQQKVALKREIVADLTDMIKGGKDSLTAKVEAEHQRKSNIILGFWNDITTGAYNDHVSQEQLDYNSRLGKTLGGLQRGLRGVMGSFEYMAQHMAKNSLGKDSWFYKYFMQSENGVMAAQENYLEGLRNSQKIMNDKTEEIFGKRYDDVVKENEKKVADHNITIPVEENGMTTRVNAGFIVNKDGSMSKAQATYLYMVWKMPDGKAKLEKMGFDDQSIAEAEEFIGQQNKDWADWVQDEYLVDLRQKYNERYKEMYNTSMGEIANYVPLKIDSETRHQDVDVAEVMGQQTLNQKTGSLINRTHNLNPVDLTNGAYGVISEHVKNMEEWYAMARVRQDLNYILSSSAIRNTMNANERASHDRLVKAAQIATGCYKTETSDANGIVSGITQGLAGANIAFRNTTALKQMLSLPAFFGYSQNPKYVAMLLKNAGLQYLYHAPTFAGTAATFGWLGKHAMDSAASSGETDKLGKVALSSTMRWCIDNIPTFRNRVAKGSVGNVILDELLSNDTTKYTRFKAKLGQYGMAANGLVDAVTCAIGIKSIYDFRYGQLKDAAKKAYDAGEISQEEYNQRLIEADRIARNDADIYYNGTQQSNHPAFLAPVQMDSDLASKMFTLYKNSPLSYARKAILPVQDLNRLRNWSAIADRQAGEYMRTEGLDYDAALKKANKHLAASMLNSAVGVGLYGYLLNWLWNWGGKGLLGLFQGDDDDDKEKGVTQKVAGIACPILNGVPVVDLIVNTAAGQDVEPLLMYDIQERLASIIAKKDGGMSQELAFELFNAAARSGLGVDLNTLTNVYLGAEHLIKNGLGSENRSKMIDLMLLLNTPNSNRKQVARTIYSQFTPEEFDEAVMRAEKALDEGSEDWHKHLAGYKILDKSKHDAIRKEYWQLHQTTDEKLREEQKKANTKDEISKVYTNTVDLEDAYEDERDPVRKAKMYEVLKDRLTTHSSESTGDAYKRVRDKMYEDTQTEKKAEKNVYLKMSTFEDAAEDIAVAENLKDATQYQKKWKELGEGTPEGRAYFQEHRQEIAAGMKIQAYASTLTSLKNDMKDCKTEEQKKNMLAQIRRIRKLCLE